MPESAAPAAAEAAEDAWIRDIGFWLHFVYQHQVAQLERDLAPLHLTATEALALRILHGVRATTPLALRERLVITKGATSKLLARLRRRGWVRQRLAPGGERSLWLSLTEAGASLVPELDRIAADHAFFFCLPLTTAQCRQLDVALRILAARKGLATQV